MVLIPFSIKGQSAFMATISGGTSETFTGTKLEGKLWQAWHYIQNGERNTDEFERFTGSKDDTFNLVGDFTLPGVLIWDATTATFKDAATPYLPSLVFTPGNPTGTFKSTTLSQYFIDLIKYTIMKQNAQQTNPAGLKNVTLEFDYNTLVYTGKIKLPYTTEMTTDGAIIERAVEWIVT